MQQDWKSSWSATHLRCGSDDVIYTHRLISQFLFVSYSITVGSDGGNIYLLGLVFFFPELDNWVNQGHQSKTREETDVHRIIKAAEKNPSKIIESHLWPNTFITKCYYICSFLNVSRDSESTTSLESLFQCLTTLPVKKIFLVIQHEPLKWWSNLATSWNLRSLITVVLSFLIQLILS